MHSAKRFKRDPDSIHDAVEMEMEDIEPVPEPEPRIFYEIVSFSFSNIEEELSKNITELTDFETLEINEVPSIVDAVNLISSDLLRQKFYQTSYSIAIRLNVIDKITTLSPLQYEIISTKIDKTRRFLLCLESLSDKKCCYYWKSGDEEQLMSLSLIDTEIVDREAMNSFVNYFLLLALMIGNDGLSQEAKCTSSTDLSLFSLADVNDKNLLMVASELGNRPVVEDLIKIGFDVNFQVDNQIAADLAWKNQHLDVLFSLLLENSLYPVDFNEANTSHEVKEFVKMTHQFVKSVKNNDETTVQNILDKYPNLRYFYSRDNVSAAFVALSKEKFNIYKIFMTKNVCVGPKEDIDKILTKFNDKKREELRKIHLEHSREPPEKFLMILHSNTSVGHDTINVNEKLNHAKSAIEYLCRISIIRLILQVVAASRDFKLIFDFNRDSVQFLDPTSSKQTRGSFFTSRQIYIAAKFFLDPLRRQEAIGTLAHELCHYAMLLVYKNNCLPYFNGDHKMAKTFHGYLKYCHDNRKKEEIIGLVFNIPKENQELRHAELIVRVPHLLALYHEDQDRLDHLRELFLPLFSFFEFKVVEDMKVALPNIETEGDSEIKKFNDKRKRKGFFTLRNFIILIFIASISVIGIILGVYYGLIRQSGQEIIGEVNKPWNAIIRHSRTDEIMCIGSLIHPEFVLTTAECVQKKNHRIPLPSVLFVVDFYPKNEERLRYNVKEINVYHSWQFNEDNLGHDISLLKINPVSKFTENFHSVNLPPQLDKAILKGICGFRVLHTILGSHSFDIQITGIDTTECILNDYKINRFLGEQQYCAQQFENKYCINGYGEQLYDNKTNTLHGLVSMGHQTQSSCVENKNLIITELGYYSDSIRNAICGERSSSEEGLWTIRTWIYDFMAAVVDKSTKQFICWSFFVNERILLTDSNCISSYKKEEIQLYRYGLELPEIQAVVKKDNIAKLILKSDSNVGINVTIPQIDDRLENLQNVRIFNNYEMSNITHVSRFYHYQNDFNERIFSSFCIQFSGGPIFLQNYPASYYGIVIKAACADCRIEDNGYNVSYVRLHDYLDWIFNDPPKTTIPPSTTTLSPPNITESTTKSPNTTTSTTSIPITTSTRFITFPTLPTFPSLPTLPSLLTHSIPDLIVNPIRGDIINQDYCNADRCRLINVFTTNSFRIDDDFEPFVIDHQYDSKMEGLESTNLNKSLKALPTNVANVFPNLVTYTFQNIGLNKIIFDYFRNLIALEVINLGNNEIESINPDAFNDTKILKYLSLEDNKIAKFDENILAPIRSLEVFLIGKNFLKDDINIFLYCTNLREIDLHKNQIQIVFNYFKYCEKLETIDFNSNEISLFITDLFQNKANLKSVDLRWNVCIDKKFVASNGTSFSTDELKSMNDEVGVCNFFQTTTLEPTTETITEPITTNSTTTIANTTTPVTPPTV